MCEKLEWGLDSYTTTYYVEIGTEERKVKRKSLTLMRNENSTTDREPRG